MASVDVEKVSGAKEAWVERTSTVIESPSQERPIKEKRLLRKVDVAIVPLLACSFFIAYLVCKKAPLTIFD
jgi:hypothetical protein